MITEGRPNHSSYTYKQPTSKKGKRNRKIEQHPKITRSKAAILDHGRLNPSLSNLIKKYRYRSNKCD